MIVEHRVEDVLAIHPERVVYMEDGEVTYQGDPAELSQVVDYHKIKLPAQDILARAKDAPETDFVPAVPPLDYSKPLIEFKEVGFRYHEDLPEVLHGINLNIHAGEVIAILGHNGSGKTTLLKHALGLLKPPRGSVLLELVESKSTTVAKAARTVGYVFQSPTQMLFAPTVRMSWPLGQKTWALKGNHPGERALAIQSVHLKKNWAPRRWRCHSGSKSA